MTKRQLKRWDTIKEILDDYKFSGDIKWYSWRDYNISLKEERVTGKNTFLKPGIYLIATIIHQTTPKYPSHEEVGEFTARFFRNAFVVETFINPNLIELWTAKELD